MITTIVLCIVGWIVCAFITGVLFIILGLAELFELPDTFLLLLFWPLGLIPLICQILSLVLNYIIGKKEHKNSKPEKRDEVENVLKEI